MMNLWIILKCFTREILNKIINHFSKNPKKSQGQKIFRIKKPIIFIFTMIYNHLNETLKRYIKIVLLENKNHITAYHCGSASKQSGFSFKFSGLGENSYALGPGIYFATEPEAAKLYCKYIQNPVLLKVEINMSGIYDPFRGQPEDMRGISTKIVEQVKKDFNLASLKKGSSLKDGPWDFGDIAKTIGKPKAREYFLEFGFNGLYTNLPIGGLEISVFNLNSIKILEEMSL